MHLPYVWVCTHARVSVKRKKPSITVCNIYTWSLKFRGEKKVNRKGGELVYLSETCSWSLYKMHTFMPPGLTRLSFSPKCLRDSPWRVTQVTVRVTLSVVILLKWKNSSPPPCLGKRRIYSQIGLTVEIRDPQRRVNEVHFSIQV